jgi:hypothetical protein
MLVHIGAQSAQTTPPGRVIHLWVDPIYGSDLPTIGAPGQNPNATTPSWCVGVDAQGVYYDTLPLTDLGTTMPAVVSLRFSIEKAVPFFPGAGKNAQSFDVVVGM